MALPRIRPKNPYAINCFQDSATNIAVSISDYIKRMNDTTFTENPWQEFASSQVEAKRSEQKIYDNGFIKDSETVLVDEFDDDLVDRCRVPTESELRQTRLMNIPTRGFCISADAEKITAESYRYLYDPEEFETPEI